MSKSTKSIAEEITKTIESELISDRSIGWESCVEQLEEIAEYFAEWARTIKDEHKDD